jgi:hypothetical protein
MRYIARLSLNSPPWPDNVTGDGIDATRVAPPIGRCLAGTAVATRSAQKLAGRPCGAPRNVDAKTMI